MPEAISRQGSSDSAAPGKRLLAQWRRLAPLPGGARLFSLLLGIQVPYTGTIRPRVEVLEPGFARVAMPDGRRVRNHLRSLHALALANLGEVTSGLAVLTGLPPGVRGIVVSLEARYLRKARGRMVAEARTAIPSIEETTELTVVSEIRDSSGALVAEVHVQWRLSPP